MVFYLVMGVKKRVKVSVKVNSGKSKIEKIDEEDFNVFLKSNAENNKANIELLKLFKKYFNCNVSDIRIVSGLSSRRKVVEIKNGRKDYG